MDGVIRNGWLHIDADIRGAELVEVSIDGGEFVAAYVEAGDVLVRAPGAGRHEWALRVNGGHVASGVIK